MRDNGVDGGGEERVAEAECIAELISERSSCFRSGESIFFVGLFVLLWYCLNQLLFDVIALLHLVLLHVGVWESPLELVVVKQCCIVNRPLARLESKPSRRPPQQNNRPITTPLTTVGRLQQHKPRVVPLKQLVSAVFQQLQPPVVASWWHHNQPLQCRCCSFRSWFSSCALPPPSPFHPRQIHRRTTLPTRLDHRAVLFPCPLPPHPAHPAPTLNTTMCLGVAVRVESLIPTCAVLAPRVGTVPITTCRTHVVPGPVIVAIGARKAARVPVQGLAPPVVLVPLWGPPRPVVPGSAKKDTIAPNAPFRTPIKGVARCICIAHVVLPCRFKCRRAITPRVATVRHRTWTTAKQVVRTTMATTTSTLEQGNGCANPVTIAALSTV